MPVPARPCGLRTGTSDLESSAPSADQLRQLLKRRASFPEELRPVAWRILLSLPRNIDAFRSLQQRGPHPAVTFMLEACATHNRTGSRGWCCSRKARMRLARILSTIVHWAPDLADVAYLPALLAPLIQVFGADDVLSFEAAAVFLLARGHDWLVSEGEPLAALTPVVQLLEATDPQLYAHLDSNAGTANTTVAALAVWPLLGTLLANSLPHCEWLTLWDHIIARWHEPMLLGACAVVLLRRRRTALLAVSFDGDVSSSVDMVHAVLSSSQSPRQPATNVIREAERLVHNQTQADAPPIIPAGLTYPLLPRRPPSVVERLMVHLGPEHRRGEVPGDLQARMRSSRARLEAAAATLKSEDGAASKDRAALYRLASHDAARFACAKNIADDDALRARDRRAEAWTRSLRDVGTGATREDATLIREQLLRSRELFDDFVTSSVKGHNSFGKLEMDFSRLLDNLRADHDHASRSHVSRLAEYKRRRCKSWAAAQRQQHCADEACKHTVLLQGQDRVGEHQRMEGLMELRRALEQQLSLERFELELQLARNEHAHALNVAEMHGKALEGEAATLRGRQREYAKAFCHGAGHENHPHRAH